MVITFLPWSKHLLISWLHSTSAVILEAPKIKSVSLSTFSPSICHEVMGPDAMILVFWRLSFNPTFSLSSRGSLVLLHFLPQDGVIFISEVIDVSNRKLVPACSLSSPTFLMMHSASKLNKQSGNIQPWCTPFPIWNQSLVPCPVLTVLICIKISQKTGQVVWYSHLLKSLLWSTKSKALA